MKTAPPRPRIISRSPIPAEESALAREQRAFRKQRPQLLKRYKGEYVALQGGRVVAHDRDDEDLAARMFARVGDSPFLIAHVGDAPLVSELPSPELQR